MFSKATPPAPTGTSGKPGLPTPPQEDLTPAQPAKPKRHGLWLDRRQQATVRRGLLATLFRPLAIVTAMGILGLAALSIGTNYWQSYQRHLAFTQATHKDDSIFRILLDSAVPPLSEERRELTIRDESGKLKRLVVPRAALDRFVAKTRAELEAERQRIKAMVAREADTLFALAFADRDAAITSYADWFFEWKRPYVILKETVKSTASRLVRLGEYEPLKVAVERDVKEYFMRHYTERVLKPKQRDPVITEGVEGIARQALARYQRAIAKTDAQLQAFLARNTRYLGPLPADRKITETRLDWDAQKWRTPLHLMEDRAFDGIIGLGSAAGGLLGGAVMGPAVARATGQVFGALSRRFVGSLGARIALAEGGAVAGGAVAPVGGQVAGALLGLAAGVAADYVMNKLSDKFGREKFVSANQKALDDTIQLWKTKLLKSFDGAVDKWFDDALVGLLPLQKPAKPAQPSPAPAPKSSPLSS